MADVLELHVNGAVHRVDAAPRRNLLGVLRDELGLSGAKYGCGEGQCGACTVLIDGHPVRSCVTVASAVAGKPITTIDGLARDGGPLLEDLERVLHLLTRVLAHDPP